MRKDRDTMSDTGGRKRPKRLQKPPRSDRRKPDKDRLKSDPDFSDTLRDPDLHPGSVKKRKKRKRKAACVDAWLAGELMKIAQMLMSSCDGIGDDE